MTYPVFEYTLKVDATPPLNRMSRAMGKAKSEIYEALHWAKETEHEKASRIAEVYADAERLWLDLKMEVREVEDRREAAMTAAFGPRIS